MSNQSYANHRRFDPYFHYFAIPLALVTLILAIVNATLTLGHERLILVLVAMTGVNALYKARMYAMKLQDRIIRTEVAQRFERLSGEPFETIVSKLTMSQIVALRFASDTEIVTLAKNAAANGTKSSEIKQSIKDWRADNWRV